MHQLTRKNETVLPPFKAPYLIFVCFAKSSALSIGESMRSTVKKAARLAVYDEIMMSVKNHHMPATTLKGGTFRLAARLSRLNASLLTELTQLWMLLGRKRWELVTWKSTGRSSENPWKSCERWRSVLEMLTTSGNLNSQEADFAEISHSSTLTRFTFKKPFVISEIMHIHECSTLHTHIRLFDNR